MAVFRRNALSWAAFAAGFAFIISPVLAQTLKARSTQTIKIASDGFFDFDTDAAGDRATADIRLVKDSNSNVTLLEPLNGAGVGFLQNSKKLYQTCAAHMDGLRASRINLSSLSKATQICVRTSENRIAVFRLGNKTATSMNMSGYSVWQRPAALPAPPAENQVFYGSQKNNDKSPPVATAAQADSLSLTFNVPVTVSNILDDVGGFRVVCKFYHPNASIEGVSSPKIWTAAVSDSVALKGGMRREHSQNFALTSTFLSGFDLSAINYYVCHIELKQHATSYYYAPTPQNPPTWPEEMRWRIHRDGAAANQPYSTGNQPIDAAALVRDNDGQIETARLLFNGLDVSLDAPPPGPGDKPGGPGPKDDNDAPNSPPPTGQAQLNTQDVTCPSRETVRTELLSQSMGANGWRGAVDIWGESPYFRDAWVDVTRTQVMCRYTATTNILQPDGVFYEQRLAFDFNFQITASGACENVAGYEDNQGGGLICSGDLSGGGGARLNQGTEPTACILRCPAPHAIP